MTTNGSGNRIVSKNQMQHKAFTADITKSINEAKRTIDFVISSETPDRHGDIIMLKGWDTKQFMENPVVLFAHSSNVPPIGKALKIWKSSGNLNATAQFMSREISPFADSVFQMFKEGFLKAVSVGFMAKEWELIDSEDDSFFPGLRFLKQELLEFSAVPVPSNPDALIKARHKGINVEPFGKWAEDMLDDWANSKSMIRETYNIGKKQIELIRRKAIGETMTYHVSEEKQKELLDKNLKAIEEQRLAKEEKEKESDKVIHDKPVFQLNRNAVAYANSLIEKDQVNIEDEIDGFSTEAKEHLSVSGDTEQDNEDNLCHIISEDTLYRKEIVASKRDSALDDEDSDVFNAASRLLKKIDGDVSFEKNEYEDWYKDLPLVEFDADDYEKLDAMQHQDGNVTSVFFNNSPRELVIKRSLFESSGGAIGFTGNKDNVSIVFTGSNIDLSYYPFAQYEDNFLCKLDSDITSVPSITKELVFQSTSSTKIADPISSASLYEFEVGENSNEEFEHEGVEYKDNQEEDEPMDTETEVFDVKLTSPIDQINILDSVLVDLEETLERQPELMSSKNGDKRFIRRIKFVAQYMRDLAEIITPTTTETKTTTEERTIPVTFVNEENNTKDNEITEKDIDEYLISNLGPTLDKIVKDNLNKMRGQLD